MNMLLANNKMCKYRKRLQKDPPHARDGFPIWDALYTHELHYNFWFYDMF